MDDVIVVGGSFAGISAALPIARARRTVRVIDSGLPRNRFSNAAHNIFGHEGRAPSALLDEAGAQLRAYPSVVWTQGEVTDARAGVDGGFAVSLADGATFEAKRLILAYGVRDRLPDIPGFREAWGKSVLHCPYCHGFEIAGKRWGVMVDPAWLGHMLPLYREWTEELTVFLNGAALAAESRHLVDTLGVMVVEARVVGLDQNDGHIRAVMTASGPVPVDALFAPQRVAPASDLAQRLGCAMSDGPLGPHITVDSRGQTSVPGISAAGDLAGPMHSIGNAIGSGNLAGGMTHQSLLFPA